MFPNKLTALGVALGLVLVAGLASAHGGDPNQVHGCVAPNGSIRIVGDDEECKANESALDWAIQGPKGEPGLQGPAGPSGASDEPNRQVVGQLLIDGIPGGDGAGDATMDVRSIDGGLTNSATFASGGGGGAGKATVSDLTIVKPLDKASPLLALAVAQGKHFLKARLDLFRPGTSDVSMRYELEDLMVVADQQFASGKAGDVPLESISLNFTKITWTYFPADGSAEVTKCYSVTEIRAC